MWLRYLSAGLEKIADHADERLRQRTDLPPEALRALRLRVSRQQRQLDPNRTYHFWWPGHGSAVIGPVGRTRRHVVKTVLGPAMSPPGMPLPDERPTTTPIPPPGAVSTQPPPPGQNPQSPT